MRFALVAVVFAVPVGMWAAQHRPTLDTPVPGEFRITDPRSINACHVGAVVAQVARQTGMPAGFESTSDCWLSPQIFDSGNNAEVIKSMSPRQILNRLMTLMPNYSWREMDGVAVVRPNGAWDDPANLLNLPARPVRVFKMPLNEALHAVLQAATPTVFLPHEDVAPRREIDRPITFNFRGGTVLEGLNALVRARRDVEWQVGYTTDRATVVLSAFDLSGGVAMAPVALPQLRR